MPSAARLIGHADALSRLERAASSGSLTHAVLITGPDNVGKTTLALVVAEALLGGAWPGGLRAHPDLWVEDSDAENLSIERVRGGGRDSPTLQDFLGLRSYAGGAKVAVMGRAERLTEQAANCMLKTIEEPPAGTHLLLCATHVERLPATVVSRCELLVLAPVPRTAIAGWLQDVHRVAAGTAGTAAGLAAGRPGRALALALDPARLGAELGALDAFLAAGGGGVEAALRTAAGVSPGAGAEGRERGLVTLAVWSSFVRDVACFAAGAPELATWTGYRPALERWAEDLPLARIVAILARLALAGEALATYAQPRLTFESLMVDIFGSADSPPAVPAREATEGGEVSGAGAAPPRRRPTPGSRARSRGGG